jgi:hypothetical protein
MLRLYAVACILGTSEAFTARTLKSGAKRTNAARCTTIMSGLIGFATMSGSDPVQIERFTLQARGSIAPCRVLQTFGTNFSFDVADTPARRQH